jgi:hypothetical protein
MLEHCADLVCNVCHTSFKVELVRMRLNFAHVCPACRTFQKVSQDQAIIAHRLLDKIEFEVGASKVRRETKSGTEGRSRLL